MIIVIGEDKISHNVGHCVTPRIIFDACVFLLELGSELASSSDLEEAKNVFNKKSVHAGMEDFFVRISNALTAIDLSGSNQRCVRSFAYGTRPRDIGTASLGASNYKR